MPAGFVPVAGGFFLAAPPDRRYHPSMAWTATLIDAVPHPENRQDIRAHVRLAESVTNETFDVFPFARDLDDVNLKRWLHTIIVENLGRRDVALPKIRALIGTTVTVTAPTPEDGGLVQFRNRWARLMRLKRLGSANATIVAQVATLQGQVETYLLANPGAIDDPLLA